MWVRGSDVGRMKVQELRRATGFGYDPTDADWLAGKVPIPKQSIKVYGDGKLVRIVLSRKDSKWLREHR